MNGELRPFGITQQYLDEENERDMHNHDLIVIPCCLCGRVECGTIEPACTHIEEEMSTVRRIVRQSRSGIRKMRVSDDN